MSGDSGGTGCRPVIAVDEDCRRLSAYTAMIISRIVSENINVLL